MKVGDLIRKKNDTAISGIITDDFIDTRLFTRLEHKKKFRRIRVLWDSGKLETVWASDVECINESR